MKKPILIEYEGKKYLITNIGIVEIEKTKKNKEGAQETDPGGV